MKNRDMRETPYWLEVEKLPKTRQEAEDINCRYFYNDKLCPVGHNAPRYTRGGRCVQCTLISSAKARGVEFTGFSESALANFTRKKAVESGDKQYVPSRPCKKGHYLRYTGSNNCVECFRISASKGKERRREKRIYDIYKLTKEDFDILLKSQNNSCKICGTEYNKKSFHIDHCHSKKNVRGLLCSKCNQGLGLFGDDINILLSAIEYLKCSS